MINLLTNNNKQIINLFNKGKKLILLEIFENIFDKKITKFS